MEKSPTSFDVAKYFLSLQDEEAGDTISNMKLQKLVYYAQGLHLAKFNLPLFTQRIKAWEHGPVIPQLWHHYKKFGNATIPKPSRDNTYFNRFTDEQKSFLNDVWHVFGQFSAWKLRCLTHEEAPWLMAKGSTDNEISHECLKSFFKSYLVDA